jgi:hypothetical protein
MARGQSDGILPAIFTLLVIVILSLAAIALFVWSLVLPKVESYVNRTVTPSPTVNATTLSPDTEFYYRLKNISCATLSKDFLIVTDDNASGSVVGLLPKVPQETAVAISFADSYDTNQTTRTYSKGEEMKKVISKDGKNVTLIWKDGRFYQCDGNCTMLLLGDAGWQAYIDSLRSMRSSCAYFGRTPLPPSVNQSRLLSIVHRGRFNVSGFTCEDFLISGNRQYASSLLPDLDLSDDQQALLWGLAHQAAPTEECLDDGVGIVVYRSVTLDLSGAYRFDYSSGGGMFVNQQTRLTYYSSDVPESFLALPG